MKVNVIQRFIDKTTKIEHKIGEQVELSNERAEELIGLKFVEAGSGKNNNNDKDLIKALKEKEKELNDREKLLVDREKALFEKETEINSRFGQLEEKGAELSKREAELTAPKDNKPKETVK
jgi:hypothetical protein